MIKQRVIKFEKSFSNIHFVKSHIAQKDLYYPKKAKRDSDARNSFAELGIQNDLTDGIFMLDIIRKDMKNESLQSALS